MNVPKKTIKKPPFKEIKNGGFLLFINTVNDSA